MGKWVLAVTLLLVAVVVAFSIFVVTGVIDGPALFWRLGTNISWMKPHLETYAHGQDAEAFVARYEDELQQRTEALKTREAELVELSNQLDQRMVQLDRREAELKTLTDKLQAEQDQRRSVRNLAEIYTEMIAADAARILAGMDQGLVLDVLLYMDKQDAANIMKELPTNLAVSVAEKMGLASQ
ncbi:MAG: hypothetical protein GX971_09505 [Firmicutes bacterium]|nr:hypothetical protein [Bacillota bacterium]